MSQQPSPRPSARRAPECPSEFALARLVHGELDQAAATPLQSHVGACATCMCVLRELRASKPPTEADWTRALAQGPVAEAQTAESAEGRLARRVTRGRWLPWAALVPVAVALMLVWGGPENPPLTEQTKGPPWRLGVIAHTGSEPTRIERGSELRAGDRLRFEVSTTWARGHVVLVSLDSRGVVSLLAPRQGGAVSIDGDGAVLLDGAVALDDAPGTERILLVGCQDPIDSQVVFEAARAALTRAGGDPQAVAGLGLGCHEQSFSIRKVLR